MAITAVQVDVADLSSSLHRVGIGLGVAAAVHALVVFLDAIALLLCSRQRFGVGLVGRTFRAQLAGHAINVTTPTGSLGELARYVLLADRIPREELAAAIVVQNVLWFETNCLFILAAAGL